MDRALLAAGCCIFLCSCQMQANDHGLQIRPAEVSADAAAVISGDLADKLSERLPAASVALRLSGEVSEFAVALETSLRASGYTVLSGETTKTKAIAVSYQLNGADEDVLASLSTDSLRLARLYDVSVSGAAPASPLSVMTLR